MVERLSFVRESLLRSYSQILFSRNEALGLCVAIATFISPAHGLAGLLAAICANLFAYLIGLNQTVIREGGFGFNAVLVGLALGTRFEWSLQFVALLLLLCILLVPLTAALNALSATWLGMSALSVPFNLVAWFAVAVSFEIGKLTPLVERWSVLAFKPGAIAFESFFSSLGAVLFQAHPISGVIVAIGLFLYSRIGLMLVFIGLSVAYGLQILFGLDPEILAVRHLGFNSMLSALAMGGVFLIPNLAGVAFGALAAALSSLMTVGLIMVLPAQFSPLALPFNVAVVMLVYTLKLRTQLPTHLILAPFGQRSPEASRERYLQNVAFAKSTVSLPFYGKWRVTQGVDGRFTHQGIWRFAYDFQAVDSVGKIFSESGAVLENYHAYGRPVLACADGVVVTVVDYVADNEVGLINLEQNWGNSIIIQHAPDFYSCSSHLKPGAAKVSPGEKVKRGQVIGFCGNSGRSPYPHLHFQLQASPSLGAATIAFEFGAVKIANEGNRRLERGRLLENQIVFPAGARVADSLDDAKSIAIEADSNSSGRLGGERVRT